MSVLAKFHSLDRLPKLMIKFSLIYAAVLIAFSLFVVSFDFRLAVPLFGMDFIFSAGIDHGSNAIHYTGLIDGVRSAFF